MTGPRGILTAAVTVSIHIPLEERMTVTAAAALRHAARFNSHTARGADDGRSAATETPL